MRKSIALKYPQLLPICYQGKVLARTIHNVVNRVKEVRRSDDALEYIVYQHQSPLKRKASIYSEELLAAKKINLSIALQGINGAIIKPGEVFSFWTQIGKPSYRKGYKDGLMLSAGKPVRGPGGGLCQLSNLLFWMAIHTEMQIIERHHHSYDSFPDDRRTLPFGSGASVLYNYYDLKIHNTTNRSYQIKIHLTKTKLRGKILADKPQKKIHVEERNHKFIVSKTGKVYRSNEIVKIQNKSELIICRNFAPVLYEVNLDKLKSRGTLVEEEQTSNISLE